MFNNNQNKFIIANFTIKNNAQKDGTCGILFIFKALRNISGE